MPVGNLIRTYLKNTCCRDKNLTPSRKAAKNLEMFLSMARGIKLANKLSSSFFNLHLPSTLAYPILIFTGFTFQILSAYSRIDLSDENLPIRATLRIDIVVHNS